MDSPIYTAVFDPRLGLTDGDIDADAVVGLVLANKSAVFVEYEETACAGEIC